MIVAPDASNPGNVSRSTDTGRPGGIVSITARRNAYRPALIWLVTGFGSFSRKAVTRTRLASRDSLLTVTVKRGSVTGLRRW